MEKRYINFIQDEPRVESFERPQQKVPKKKGFLLICAIISLFVVFGCTRFILSNEKPNNPDAYDPITLEPKKPEGILRRIGHFVLSKDIKLKGQSKDRINVLLLGMGGPGHDGPFLTDTIILSGMQPSTKRIAMISIPRDLGVDIPGHGYKKINYANAAGEAQKQNYGATFATQIIEDTFDIDIHYYIRIDFTAFEKIIDEIGGITVDIKRSFTDEQYPDSNHGVQTISFEKGVTKMNGETALKYARSRHGNNGEGSDFARAERQQKVLTALKEKILSFGTLANPVKIYNIIQTLSEHITTNMEFADIIALLRLGKELNTGNIITKVLDNGPNGYLQNAFSEDGAFILEPKNNSFDEINSLIENIFETPVEKNEQTVMEEPPKQEAPPISAANVEIQNGTWQAGLAARIRQQLQDKKFTVNNISNSSIRPQMESAIYNLKGNNIIDAVSALQEELKYPVKQTIPEKITFATTTDILIILGEDTTK
jgi:LCP family protein required for cell wall assembly